MLGFSIYAFYTWTANPVSNRGWDDAHLINAIIDIHANDPELGCRFITDERHTARHAGWENRVQRLCALPNIA